MNAIISALANGLVLSFLLAAVVWIALRLLKRGFNPATRYAIWWIALLAMVALPIIFLAAANRRMAEPARPGYRTTGISATDSVASSSNSAPVTQPPSRTKRSWLPSIPVQVPFSPWTARFGELWALISLLLLARLAAGFVALHFQKKYAGEASAELRELLDHCVSRLAIRRRVRVGLIREGNSPMLAGVIRPCVLIPERLLPELNGAELQQILLHEATHAARYDDWALLLQRVIQALFVFYPVVHWMAHHINLEREAACDADVISVTGDARAYVKCLTHVAELSLGDWKSPLAAAIAAEKSYLARRIVMLMDSRRHTGTRVLTRRLVFAAMAVCLLAALAAISPAFFVSAQSPDSGADWEKAAGGKMSFEVASVKQNPAPFGPDTVHFNMGIQPNGTDDLTPSGGLFEATNFPLRAYLDFAYKLSFYQAQVLRSEAPKWVVDDRFDIQARAAGTPTTDQFRLMVQGLFAERFKMTAHRETRRGPVYALGLAKAGKTGPLLRPFPDGVPCSSAAPPGGRRQAGSPGSSGPTPETVADGQFPAFCGFFHGSFVTMPSTEPGRTRLAARNVSWDQIKQNLLIIGGQLKVFDRPVLDRTGLSGQFDIALEWSPRPLDASASADQTGPTLTEALKDQLGIKLESTAGPAQVFVIDHIEEPTPN